MTDERRNSKRLDMGWGRARKQRQDFWRRKQQQEANHGHNS